MGGTSLTTDADGALVARVRAKAEAAFAKQIFALSANICHTIPYG